MPREGECQFFPPTVVWETRDGEDCPSAGSHRPMMDGAFDWCGQWQLGEESVPEFNRKKAMKAVKKEIRKERSDD